jgi:hypothetical protein
MIKGLERLKIRVYKNLRIVDTSNGFVITLPFRWKDNREPDEFKKLTNEVVKESQMAFGLPAMAQWRQLDIRLKSPFDFALLERWLFKYSNIRIGSVWQMSDDDPRNTVKYRMILMGPDSIQAPDEVLTEKITEDLKKEPWVIEKGVSSTEKDVAVSDFVDLKATVAETDRGVRISMSHRLDSVGLVWRVLDALPPGWVVDGKVRTRPVKVGSTISIELSRGRAQRFVWLYRLLDSVLGWLISLGPPKGLLGSLENYRAGIKEHIRTARAPPTERDLQELRSTLNRLKLLRIKPAPIADSRRLWLHFWLTDVPSSLKQVFRALSDLTDTSQNRLPSNVISGELQPPTEEGEPALVDFDVMAPKSLPPSAMAKALNKLLAPSAKNPRQLVPLVSQAESQKLEIAVMTMSKATAKAVCNLLRERLSAIPGWTDDLPVFRDVPGEEKGKVDEGYVKQVRAVLDLMDDIHGNPYRADKTRWPLTVDEWRKMKSNPKLPYVVHLMESSYSWIASGKRHNIGAIDCLLHDAFESGPKNIWDRFTQSLKEQNHPLMEQFKAEYSKLGLEIDEVYRLAKENELEALSIRLADLEPRLKLAAREKIEERMSRDIKFYPDKIIRDIEALTKYQSYKDYTNNLSDSDLDYLIELKLWEQANNYKTLHLIDNPEHAPKILSRGVRYMLPFVMESTFQRTDAYQYSRREFLYQMIKQTLLLPRDLYPYQDVDSKTGKPEAMVDYNQDVAHVIDEFLAWLDDADNASMIPSDRLEPGEMTSFRDKLIRLRNQAFEAAEAARLEQAPQRIPQIQPTFFDRYVGFINRLLSWLTPAKAGRHLMAADRKKIEMDIKQSRSAA